MQRRPKLITRRLAGAGEEKTWKKPHKIKSPMRLQVQLMLLLPSLSAAALLEAAATNVLWSTRCLAQQRLPMRLGVDVAVLPNDKGSGLYAMRDLEEGQLVGLYRGAIKDDAAYQEDASSGSYAMGLANGKIVDGENPRRSSVRSCVSLPGPMASATADCLSRSLSPVLTRPSGIETRLGSFFDTSIIASFGTIARQSMRRGKAGPDPLLAWLPFRSRQHDPSLRGRNCSSITAKSTFGRLERG